MNANEKFDFLMKLTGTSNSTLGKYLNFDASYISRIRSGKRNFPANLTFAEPAAAFFAEHIGNSSQKKIAADLLEPGSEWPDNHRTAQKRILLWLLQTPSPRDFSAERPAAAPSGKSGLSPILPSYSEQEIHLFYGNAGKRQAVAEFLRELGQMEKPPQLLLYSSEAFDWMYEDPEFARQWGMLLLAYLKKGGRIKIAHTVSRAAGEMFEALQKWIPVYLTGAVEPYYYPKILDRVFRQTLFVAQGHSAITSNSVVQNTDTAVNFLIRDRQAVKALEQQFWEFFEMCRPLMQICRLSGKESFFQILEKFHSANGSQTTVLTAPSLYTMPESTAKSMALRQDGSWILKFQKAAGQAFFQRMAAGETLTEILNLPGEAQLRQGNLPVFTLFDGEGLHYTREELADHLDNMIGNLKAYPNYRAVLSHAIPENQQACVLEDRQAILVKTDVPRIAFVLDEPRMVSAFWEYLQEIGASSRSKEETIAQLEALKDSLREVQTSDRRRQVCEEL